MKKWLFIMGVLLTAIVVTSTYSSSPGRIEFRRFEDDANGRKAIFEIINQEDKPLYLYGYDVRSPIYQLKVLTPAGWWKSEILGWCGTGVGLHSIPVGGTSQFDVYEDPHRPGLSFRAGVRLHAGVPVFGGGSTSNWVRQIRELLGLGDPDITWSDATH